MASDVFISYSSNDMPAAEALRRALEDRGIRCWMAPESIEPGVVWESAVVEAIRKDCRLFLLLFSAYSARSYEVFRELCLAANRLPILPFLKDKTRPGDPGVIRGFEYYLGITQCVRFSKHRLGEACAQVVSLLGRGLPKTSPSTPAASAEGPGPDGSLEEVKRVIGREMVRQRQANVEVTALPPEERRAVERMLALGVLREFPSPRDRKVTYVGFQLSSAPDETPVATGERAGIVDAALAHWVGDNLDRGPAHLVAAAEEFPLLADGIAFYFANAPAESLEPAKTFFAGCVRQDEAVVERLVASTLESLETSAKDLVAEFAEVASRQGGLRAQRGLARAARRRLDQGRSGWGEPILEGVARWAEQQLSDPAVAEFRCEIANERGCMLVAQRRFAEAEGVLRAALAEVEAFRDRRKRAIHRGAITNNLVRAIIESGGTLDLPDDRFAEARTLLENNVKRLRRTKQSAELLAVSHSHLGQLFARRDPRRAERHLRKDVHFCRKLGDRRLLADALDNLGVFLADERRMDEAAKAHAEELALFDKKRLFDLKRHARALANEGRCHFGAARQKAPVDRSRLDRARQALLGACKIFSSLDEPALYAPTLENLGRAMYLLGKCEQGLETLRRAVAQYARLPDGGWHVDRIQNELDALGAN